MIRQSAITDALKAHLAELPGKPPVVWENADGDLPAAELYFIVQSVHIEPARITMDGVHRYTGLLQVTVVVPAGKGTRIADDQAWAVSQHFYGQVFEAGGGRLRITDQPHIRDGYQDGVRWRVPCLIRFTAIA